MNFKDLFTKELEAGASVEDILKQVAESANQYEESLKSQKNDQYEDACCVIESLLEYMSLYTSLDVNYDDETFDTIVRKFMTLMDSVKYIKLW